MPIVKTPDGKVVSFPDSMPEQEINAALDKEYSTASLPVLQKPSWINPVREDIVKPLGIGLGGAAGGILGGMAGGVGAIPGGVIGATLGGSGLPQLFDRTLEIAGITKPKPFGKVALNAGREAVESGLIQMTGDIFGSILGWFIKNAPLSGKGYSDAAEKISSIAKKEGIDLPAPAITGSEQQAGLYQTLRQTPSGGDIIQQDVANTLKQMEMQQKNVKSKFKLDVTPTVAGQTAKEGSFVRSQDVLSQAKENWNTALKIGEKDGVMVKPLESNALKAKLENDPHWINMPPEFKERINNFFRTTTEEVPIMRPDYSNISGRTSISTGEKVVSNKEFPISVMDEWRKDFQNLASSGEIRSSYQQKLFKDFQMAIEKDMANSAKQKGSEAYNLLLNARDFESQNVYGVYKGKGENYQKAMGKRLLELKPEQVLNYANDVTGLKELKSTMPTEYFDVVRRGKLAEVFDSSLTWIETPQGQVQIVSGSKLRNAIYRDMTPEYRANLITPEERKALDNVIVISDAMNRIYKLGGSQSGTPKGMLWGSLITGGGGAAIGSMLSGSPGAAIGAGAGLALSQLGPMELAKFVTSKSGKDYLIQGLKSGPFGQNVIKSLSMGTTQKGIELFRSPELQQADQP